MPHKRNNIKTLRNTKEKISMKQTRILFLTALIAGLGSIPGWQSTSAAQGCQQEGACFVFESQGYITDPATGQTTIAFRVTNKCRSLVSYVAIGTGGHIRHQAPAFVSNTEGDGCLAGGRIGDVALRLEDKAGAFLLAALSCAGRLPAGD